ncbi:MAG: hypothetical protein KF850_21895, partial [Labilithrix sp.]|nr:hypothetical protein [Labilithrix sp.]
NNGGCDPLSVCTNTPGSHSCGACPAGYSGTGASSCVDVDECLVNHGGCDALTTCTNTPGGFTCGACPAGFTGDGASGCVDVDECATNNGGCDPLSICTNTPGGFTCGACPAGYSGTGASGCHDIDECATGNGGCDALTACTNTAGGFTCGACPAGYSGGGATGCHDIDECTTGNGGCDALTTCTNTAGGFACGACPAGFTGTGATGCVDVDECAHAHGGCDALATCTNTPGSYSCGACPAGFTGTGATGCNDVDECATNNGGCDVHTTCTNTPGSFICGACPAGFTGTGATGCHDIDECATNNGGCDVHTTCTNTPGSRTCGACPAGFTGTGEAGCVDVDECATNNGGCDVHTACTNTQGSRTCGACPAGYSGTGEAGCVDIDECAADNGGCDPIVTCTNTPGGHTCGHCPNGYSGTGATGCHDIDECAVDNGGCDALTTCTNTPGGHACGSCPAGYSGGGSSGCVDVDECATNNGGCDAITTCTNTPGGHTCGACPAGFTGNGETGCVDVDECATASICDPLTTCSNTPGGFACSACPNGYAGSGETSCTDIDECATDNGGCHADATCTNTPGSRTCACPDGLTGDGVTSCAECTSFGVGDSVMTRTGDRPSFCISNTGGAQAEYLLIPMNLTRDASYPLTITATNLAVPNGATTAGPGPAITDNHNATRAAHHAEIAGRLGTTGTGTAVSPPAFVPTGTPTVGATWTLNADLATACTSGTARAGTVRYVGTHAIVVSDDTNPAGGLTTQQYSDLGAHFDNIVYPAVTALYGEPTDHDANQRVVLFYTRAVNELDPPATHTSVSTTALTLARDVATAAECPTSNRGELIYLAVPDPTGTINSNVRTVSYIEGQAGLRAAHELTHLIVDSRRIAAGAPFEETWLDEGLAGIAEERGFYAWSVGLTPLTNIVLSNLNVGPSASLRVRAYNTYQNHHYTRMREWMRDPSLFGFADGAATQQAQRGMSWMFLRYAADRAAAGSPAAEASFLRDLANASTTGFANLEARIGGAPNLWMRDFLASVFIDDSAIPNLDVPGPYRADSWNYRSIFGGLGGFLLQNPQVLVADTPLSLNLAKGGGANYRRFALAAGTETRVSIATPPGTGWDAWYMVLRRQ